MSKRIGYLDALKGFVIILVVIGHVADGYLSANIYKLHNSLLFNIYNFIYSFHMPLFFLISGFLYSHSYLKNEIKKDKILNQLLNVLYLYFVFSIIQWLFKYFFNSVTNTKVSIKDLYLLVVKPMAPYWYLYNLMIYYVGAYMLYRIIKKRCLKIVVVCVCIVISVLFLKQSVLHFFVFFLVGVYLNQINLRKEKLIYICGFIISMIMYIVFYNSSIYYNRMPVVGTIIALVISLCTFLVFKQENINNRVLEYIGRNSLEIYLIHCYFTAFNRVFLIKIGISNFYLNFIVNCVLSIVVCLIIAQITTKLKVHDYIFMPFKRKGIRKTQ